LLAAVVGLALRMKKRLYDQKWFLQFCRLIAPIGFISIITGWFTAELGRQPWVVYNFIKTVNAQSPLVLHQIIISLVSIVIVYGVIFGYFYFRYFFKAIKIGPEAGHDALDQAFFYMSPVIGKKETKSKK
jgi:cytochrome d ubiquinol oxidase subunit I